MFLPSAVAPAQQSSVLALIPFWITLRAVDGAGNVLIADMYNHRIRRWEARDGAGATRSAPLDSLHSIAVARAVFLA